MAFKRKKVAYTPRQAALIEEMNPGALFKVHVPFVAAFNGAQIPRGLKLKLQGYHKPGVDEFYGVEGLEPGGLRIRFDIVDHPGHSLWLTEDEYDKFIEAEIVTDVMSEGAWLDRLLRRKRKGPSQESVRVVDPSAETVSERVPKRASSYPLRVQFVCADARRCAKVRSLLHRALGMPHSSFESGDMKPNECIWYYDDAHVLEGAVHRLEEIRDSVERFTEEPISLRSHAV